MHKNKENGQGEKKPDKTCHYNQNMGTEAKDAKLPGQMYVPTKTHNESDFVGEKKSSY